MEIRIACIGKLKSKAILELESAYLTRLRKRCQLSIQEIDDRPHAKLSASERRIKDSHRVLESIGKHEALVVLDEGGRKYSSYDFASFLNGFITTSSIKPVFA
ncbi:MAG: 23S rRNA (pseudouridine(1915)-N(3))-methyltransferase RlmH, partial [Bdellovibrionales bacterium]|nr:23S rRNA (pseudouridine(1915)-N(3))-methyltransferase RlmH [Bdellovibrionales bacterium]